MARRFVISDERVVNCFGVRVMTAGIDISQYERNPVLLYDHNSSILVIGRVENLQKEGPVLTAEFVFDMGDSFAAEIARKVEENFIRACSPNLEVLDWSDSPELMLAGQRGPTATRTKLVEISVTGIPGNDGALALKLSLANGLRLSEDAAANAELFKTHSTTPQPPKMNLILSHLKLSAGAAETDVVAAIQRIQAEADNKTAEAVTSLALKAGLIGEDKQASFLKLARVDAAAALDFLDLDKLKTAAAGGSAVPKDLQLSKVVAGVAQANAAAGAEGDKAKDPLEALLLSRPEWSARDWEKKDPKNWLALKRAKPEVHDQMTRAYYNLKG
jgi:hypothetical protein